MDEEITAFFSADPETISWPYPMYQRWREGTGVLRWESGPATVVTHYADVKAVMAGAYPTIQNAYRFGELAEGTIARLPMDQHEIFFKVLDFEGLFMSRKEGGEHARLRRIAARAFTARRIEQLRASVQKHVDDLIEEMLGKPDPDVKRDLANKLPVRVIVDLIGVPQEDRDLIWEWSEAVGRLFSLDEKSLREADEAIDAFREYVGRTVDRVRRTGEGPELAKAMLEQRDNEALTEEELVAMYLLILFGGSETTTNLLGNGFLALQRHRDQWDMLVREPELVRPAIEELIRYDSPHHYLPRVVAEDFELRGTELKKNQTLIVVMGAANHDESYFPNPSVLDVTRPNKADHLSFAFGVHYCLGAALARLEGEVAFTSLLTRFPDARLLDDQPSYGGSAMLRAIQHLPTDLGAPVG
ncbi:cytochrome P450 [Plantactinospora mayteni]|uniref:Polyketide biosynthesis cytochrome P450 PksS n=1 Tax=Plantactinospora mayteni TaxID=566021 RepID=A0ABQ4EY39_9ACTN|nr:cytochrome P450 [Plantactinospora mayteni]GIG99564.1 polyketide biosynthesis cytochrome P450 PksS [Plantactinospora mayteni]